MAENNLFCDTPNCGEPAVAFGFVQGAKVRVCRLHTLSLVDKRVTVLDIAAYDFVKSAQDGPLYEHRRSLSSRGLGALAALETTCENDLMQAHAQLLTSCASVCEAAVETYRGLWEQTCRRYQDVVRDLQQHRKHFEQLLVERELQLSPDETALCEGMPSGSLFRLILGNCRSAIAECLSNCTVLLPAKGKLSFEAINRKSQVASLLEFARQLRYPEMTEAAQRFTFELQGEVPKPSVRQANPPTQDLSVMADQCLRTARETNKRGEFKVAVEELQRGLASLKQASMQTSKSALLLNLGLMETYHQMAEWRQTIQLCEGTLQVWGRSDHSFEVLQILYYLTVSHHWFDEFEESFEIMDQWQNQLVLDSPSAHCVLQYIQAMELMVQQQSVECVALYEQALKLSQQHLPHSFLTVCSRGKLGRAYEGVNLSKAAAELARADSLFSAYFPFAFDHAICLTRLGSVHQSLKQLDKAEVAMQGSRQLLSTHFPQRQDYAMILNNLGSLYMLMQRPRDGEQLLLTGISTLEQHYPLSENYESCLWNLGNLYVSRDRLEDAEVQYLKGKKAAELRAPGSARVGEYMTALGSVYRKMNRLKKAEESYRQACQYFETHQPQSMEHAECLMEMAMLYEVKGNKKKAAAKRTAAERIIKSGAGADASFMSRLLINR